ncbi:MAG TPA: 16S rRNA (cytosine(1402)-N(4))-methyltransferase RsmH, partial [Patescibacteria group bacterium]
MEFHTPVLLQPAIKLLDIQKDKIYIDATLGNGGHTLEILKQGAIVFGIDQDPTNLNLASQRIKEAGFSSRFHPLHGNFSDLKKIISQNINQSVSGILFDLGLSSNQLTAENRGFSFNDNLSLDMRLDPQTQDLTAEEIINTYPFDELYLIFSRYAQEVYSKPIILRIISQRQKKPIKSAGRLADIIRDYYRERHIKSDIDPSTKVFMALRMYVNDELNNLNSVLEQTLDLPAARVCIITFHSGEDRLVKRFIQIQSAKKTIKTL